MENNSILERYPLIQQFLKFALIGAMNTLVDLGILNILITLSGHADGIYFTVFKTISFTGAVALSYNLNKRWTFRDTSEEDRAKKFTQFLTISLIGAVINVSTASLVVNYVEPMMQISFLTKQLWANIGALAGTGIGLIWNFAGYKFIVFKK
jgi:putative flippase GtrA